MGNEREKSAAADSAARLHLRRRARDVAEELGDPALEADLFASFASVFIVSFSEGLQDWNARQHPRFGGLTLRGRAAL